MKIDRAVDIIRTIVCCMVDESIFLFGTFHSQ